MSKSFWKIHCLYKIMGADAFRFFNVYMAGTVLPLVRFLEDFSLDDSTQLNDLHELYKKHKKAIFTGNGQKQWGSILQQISLLLALSNESQRTLDPEENNFINDDIIDRLLKRSSLDEVEKYLHDTLQSVIISILESEDLSIDPDVALEKLKHIDIQSLLQARSHMRNDTFNAVFDHMLQADLTNQGLDDFLHNTEQTSKVGRKLAKHNEAIAKILHANNIDPNKALRYSKVMRFSDYAGTDSIDIKQLVKAVWAQIFELHRQLQDPEHYAALFKNTKKKKQLKKLKNQLNEIVKNISGKIGNKSAKDLDLKELQFLAKNGHVKKTLDDVKQLILALKDSDLEDKLQHEQISEQIREQIKEFIEHADHLLKFSNDLDSGLKKTDLKQHVKADHFRIEHWDKSDIRTYKLGNFVGCCLATNNSQFPAMIQRRMDDGMFMHVVIDEKTELPVALIWLFFAKDEKNPDGGVKIVANFHEIHSRFGLFEKKRDLIVNMMMKFTGEHYAQDIGASDFIMRHLRYGHIPDFTQFDLRKPKLTKVGGFLSPDPEKVSTPEQCYYLEALRERDHENEPTFHQYDASKQRHLTLPAYTIETRRELAGEDREVVTFPPQKGVPPTDTKKPIESAANHPASLFPAPCGEEVRKHEFIPKPPGVYA